MRRTAEVPHPLAVVVEVEAEIEAEVETEALVEVWGT